MNIARLPIFILAIGMTFAMASASSAVTIDCATIADDGCFGGAYTLNIVETSPDMWTATYMVDTTGTYTNGAEELINIEFKVAKSYTDPMLTSGTAGVLEAGPLSGQGCNGSNTGFICVKLDDSADQPLGGVYTWTVTFGTDSILEEGDWHLGARYVSDSQQTGMQISLSPSDSPGDPVPEPTAALLFGAGVLVAGSVARRPRD